MDSQQAAMQQQAMMMPMGLGLTSMTSRKNEVLSALKELVNADEIIENIKFQLSGKKIVTVMDAKGQEQRIERIYHKPLMNDEGISNTVADFRSYVNANVILSYYEQGEIEKWGYVYFSNTIFHLARNIRKYDINSRENHAKIRNILHVNFRAVMGRAIKGMTLLTSLKNIDVQEVRQFAEQKQNPFNIFSRRGQ